MKELYLRIVARLQEQVPELKLIKLFNNQFDNIQDENSKETIFFPCCFIEFKDEITYTTANNHNQYGVATLTFHIGIESYSYEDPELIFGLKDKVYKALQNYKSDVFSPLLRLSERTDTNHSNIYIYQIDFVSNFVDPVATRTLVEVSPVIKLETQWNNSTSGVISTI